MTRQPLDVTMARHRRCSGTPVHRADQLVRIHFELQAAFRSARLHERRESSAGLDRQEEHGIGSGPRALIPMERTFEEPAGGPFSRILLLRRSRWGRSGCRRATEDTSSKEWFDPKDEPYDNERSAYQSSVWQCRYSGIEVPDSLWSYAEIGVGKLYADTQADSLENEPAALAAFDEWTRRFAQHVESKGTVEGADDVPAMRSPRRNE
jgi:hypothetical protein